MSKNRPSWRLAMGGPPPGSPSVFKGYQSHYGDGHPNRRQCIAMARSTGQQCRRDAMQGSTCCASHGGHKIAYLNAPKGFISLATGRSAVRQGLIKIAKTEPFPKGIEQPRSLIEQGKIIEAERNKAWLNGRKK